MAETEANPGPPALPRATYRLQLHKGFGFPEATELVPYLAALGVSHLYSSPFLMARPGSTHGYDIIDHNRLNPELGDEAGFDRLIAALHEHGMGLILDFVPNHMGIGGAGTPWWLDVLEWGQMSPYADFFDIDWSPMTAGLNGKVLLPFLGDHYGHVLERGELQLRFDREEGSFSVWYYEHRFPIAVRDYPHILSQARYSLGDDGKELEPLIVAFGRLDTRAQSVQRQAVVKREAEDLKAQLAGLSQHRPELTKAIEQATTNFGQSAADPSGTSALHELLERQPYRLAYWRVASDEINYRRFFDINDLAALRMEKPELFEVSHRLVFSLIAEGKLQGLRIDHIDGLYNPADYCRRIQDRASYLQTGPGAAHVAPVGPAEAQALDRLQPLYLLVEKILARHEHLHPDWAVDGTTGYDFLNLVNGLFVDPAAERSLTETYRRFIGREIDFEATVIHAKRQIVQSSLASETNVLANRLYRLAQQSWTTRDYTLTSIRCALIEILAHFPVYRTYITGAGLAEGDRRYLDWSVAQARKASLAADLSIFDFLYSALTTDLQQQAAAGYRRDDIVTTAMKVQQVTGPVMAKAFEDTALYRYHRLVSLNDVGGEPDRFGVTPSAFHHLNQVRLTHHPFAMLATATHDHKRGEDLRARLNVLTEMPDEWGRRVRRWARINRRRRGEVEGAPAPSRNDEYLLYQTLVGACPPEIEDPADPALAAFAERIAAYMVKAVREAKQRSSWTNPNQAYEAAVQDFVHAILRPVRGQVFLADLLDFAARIGPAGAMNGLAQTLVKLTAPGVPDTYQGGELWDLSLVDPDNRRPVDFARRRAFLAESESDDPSLAALLEGWRDGRIKQFVMARTLRLRARLPLVFATGDYQPITAEGEQAERVFAFARRMPDSLAVTVVPRLAGALLAEDGLPLAAAEAWADTWIEVPGLPDRSVPLRNAFSGATITADNGRLRLADLLTEFPVALLSWAES